MNKKVIKNEHTFLVDLDSGKKSTFVSAMFDLSSQAEMLVDEAFASDRPILMILPSESKTGQPLFGMLRKKALLDKSR